MTTALFGVLDGGLLTTVQDAGRPDWTHLGVPESGAADPWSLVVANLLVGNEPAAAAFEMTLVGPTLAVHAAVSIGLAGADLGARIRDGRRLAPGRSHRLAADDVLEIPGDDSAEPGAGSRAYLAIPGGVDVPAVLGSRSTCLAGGFGGLDGRPLRLGDQITATGAAATVLRPELVWPDAEVGGGSRAVAAPATLRVVAGPADGLDALVAREWRVGSAADRIGVRLDGDPVADGIGGETTTIGVPWGAIQIPPDGRPIVLGADHQTTGGYRVVGVVISADLPLLGQLRPGAPVRLVATDRVAALVALETHRSALLAGAAALRDAAGWDALIESAGG
jgi:antagonist of KipI